MKTVYVALSLLFFNPSFGQSVSERIGKAIGQLEKDSQFSHAIISICVADGKTGNTVFQKNAQSGLAPASCQKIITSAAAFELLGKNYQYKTAIKVYPISDTFHLGIDASGDPTLGSWRWETTKMEYIYKNISLALKGKNINYLPPDVTLINNRFTFQPIPDGWVWQDIGNYYGAGVWGFNWHENQYDLFLSSGNIEGDPVEVKGLEPAPTSFGMYSLIKTGKKGSGDNAYIYSAPFNNNMFATGTIPPGQKKFIISGSMPDPALFFISGLKRYSIMEFTGITFEPRQDYMAFANYPGRDPALYETILTILSPTFDSINYWFLKKSVNLFGEAFVKTIAYEKTGTGSTDTGVAIIKNFWSRNGIDKAAINIIDGSGLSPANRVTTNALVKIMQYAKARPWFSSFYNALPEMNGIKMKDGYIGGVRSYTGYIKNKNGTEYTFAFIVNNFDGDPGTVREKMWKILELLK
ncbi:MAG: D-alanyl-D-alanine carboxypeptidase/D-alanyl-D-alanine-endopeptidase [Ferruginibacter sp.]